MTDQSTSERERIAERRLRERYEKALEKIADASTYLGSASPSTKLGRAIDIARSALVAANR